MNVLIVDDEAPARARLASLVDDIPDASVVGEAATGADALAAASAERPEVVLLDIRMPGMDGIETAHHLNRLERPPAVIFTTAYDEYAIEAFDAQAVGYLLKPVRRQRLERALVQAARLTRGQLDALAGGAGAERRRHVCARVRDELRLIPVRDVFCFLADQKYVRAVHRRGEDLIDESLKSLEEEFSDDLLRIHRSTLVGARHLAALERDADGQCRVRLRGMEERLPVSRRHLGDLKRYLRDGAR